MTVKHIGAWLRWLEHLVRDQGVVRSNRIAPIFFFVFMTAGALFAGTGACGSYNGPTGLMNIPSGSILSANEQTFSLHRYQIKYSYGFFSLFELGVMTDFDSTTSLDVIAKKLAYNFKAQLLTEKNAGFNLGAGFEGNNVYASADKTFPELQGLKIIAGTGNNRFNWFFLGLSYPVHPVLDAMLEYDGQDYNLGGRLKLSSNVTFDLYLKGLRRTVQYSSLNEIVDNSVIFGISYTEVFNFSIKGLL